MKGADQCPRCGCRKTGDMRQALTGFYAGTLRVCRNCGAAWEPFDEAALLDAGERYSSFREPCDNCAFRKGSPESSDPEKFREMLDGLGWFEGRFNCHKGVPIDPRGDDGSAYPRGADGKPNPRRLRLCRGYLNWLNSPAAKAKLEAALAERAQEASAES